MYLGVDIGGTKTLVGVFTKSGELRTRIRFETPHDYPLFRLALEESLAEIKVSELDMACVAAPGKLNRKTGVIISCGNLPWKNIPLEKDVTKLIGKPVLIENDANLAGLSEAKLIINDFKRVLYITISTGIGTGIIMNGVIDPDFVDSEGGHMPLEHNGKIVRWEDFASGRAIEKRFGKQAREIHDDDTWRHIVKDIAAGILNLIAVVQPEVIVLGGGVGTHFNRFDDLLRATLKKYELPITPTPPLRRAKRPEDAVLYGCYELIRQKNE